MDWSNPAELFVCCYVLRNLQHNPKIQISIHREVRKYVKNIKALKMYLGIYALIYKGKKAFFIQGDSVSSR